MSKTKVKSEKKGLLIEWTKIKSTREAYEQGKRDERQEFIRYIKQMKVNWGKNRLLDNILKRLSK